MKHPQSGVSLIEVMIVVLIAAILIAAAIPSFTTWIQNVQIRTAGESISNGLQTARNEAIRRNECVQVRMTDSPQTSWEVRLCKNGEDVGPATLILGRSHSEGSENARVVLTPPGTFTTSFNALGRVIPNPTDGTVSLTAIDVRNTTLAADDERKLRLEIPTGGGVRLCDPKNTLSATDPRRCVTQDP